MEALCRCLQPAPIVGSRVARRLAGGPRAHALFVWIDWYTEQLRVLGKLRQAAQALANVPLKRGFNQMVAVHTAGVRARQLLRDAVRGIINSKARKVFNAWVEMRSAKLEHLRKIRLAAAAMSPEGRAKRAVLLKLVWIKRRKEAMRKALNGFILAGCKHAIQVMVSDVDAMRKLRKGGTAIRLRKVRMCWNNWSETAAAAKERAERMRVAMMRMTPEGRMMLYGWSMMREQLEEVRRLRAALSGFVHGATKRAFSAWIESTFEAFHLASGLDGHAKYRIRRAIQLWVSRARIRRGLRKQVWTAAQKGEVELMRLLEMMEQAEQEDLANAIIALDKQGQTPLLWAAKKGFAEVA